VAIVEFLFKVYELRKLVVKIIVDEVCILYVLFLLPRDYSSKTMSVEYIMTAIV